MILAAAAALVACSKTELVPAVENDAETEITYTVAPKVRATTDFNKNWKFMSYAFYLGNKTDGTATPWSGNTVSSTTYINGIEISNPSATNAEAKDVWRNADKKYYWPKNGQLTFFAWTNVKENRTTAETTYTFSNYITGVSVDKTNGVKITNYDVTATENKNVDILVADIKADQSKNTVEDETGHLYREGVPTLFKHKLSKVYFTAKTDKDYKTTDGIKFYVNSIVFKGIAKQGTYTQGVDATACTGAWTSTVSTDAQNYFVGVAGAAEGATEVESTVKDVFNTGSQYYYMPQDFTNNGCFVVTYTIDYGNGVKEENLTQTCNLADHSLQKFEISKFYTINLTFTLNEILWDPAVQEWEPGSADVTINK